MTTVIMIQKPDVISLRASVSNASRRSIVMTGFSARGLKNALTGSVRKESPHVLMIKAVTKMKIPALSRRRRASAVRTVRMGCVMSMRGSASMSNALIICTAMMESSATARKPARAARERARYDMDKKGVNRAGKDIDHVKPLSKGGTNAPKNLKLKTPSANRSFKRNSDHTVKSNKK